MTGQRLHSHLLTMLLLIPFLFTLTSAAQQPPAPQVVDLTAPDGVKLKAPNPVRESSCSTNATVSERFGMALLRTSPPLG
jgi:hypothetical protein